MSCRVMKMLMLQEKSNECEMPLQGCGISCDAVDSRASLRHNTLIDQKDVSPERYDMIRLYESL